VARIMTLGILGDKYVDITQGQSGEQPLNQGDFLKGVIPLDFGELTDTAVATLENLNAILVSGKSMTHKIDQGEGFLGALLNDPQLARDMHRLLSSTSDLLMAMKSSEGSLGLFLHDSTVYNNLASITNSFSDITMKILEGEGFLGKLIADPSLYANLESLTAQADSLVYNMSNRGTTGRFLTDDQVYEEVAQLLNDMQTLMQDVKSHPRKYINLKVF
ncbi:MAG: MlaD family protein, partial [bacterium]